MHKQSRTSNRVIGILISILAFGSGAQSVFAQASTSTLYVPLIGITSVPDPLTLPNGAGNVTYHYAVKNFLQNVALSNVQVVDDTCAPIKFVTGDDNSDGKLDFTETWRYTCTTKLSATTESTATATGSANGITATHRAYATVVVGQTNPAPLVSIVNITKVAYPLSLPAGGGSITFTYRVNNPGVVPLSDVVVTDDKCSAMSGELGDTNGNNLLDTDEVWTYTCTTNLTQTTTNTAHVTATANGFKASDDVSLTVDVANPVPGLPATGTTSGVATPSVAKMPSFGLRLDIKTLGWSSLAGILAGLILLLILTRKPTGKKKTQKKQKLFVKILLAVLVGAAVGTGVCVLLSLQLTQTSPTGTVSGVALGWKFPVSATKFPSTGSAATGDLTYSTIQDPGGIPQGLPVRLQIPSIGVDSAIEDALITPDGRMDVPAGTIDVAWFALGPHPGEVGSAVIGGHYGIQNGVPFVFYNLNKLNIGDKIYIINDEGDTLTFQVRSTASFGLNADATTVFTSTDGLAHLNLITCEGIWNAVDGNYPDRLVVFADLIPTVIASTPAAVGASTASSTSTFPRSLSVGASGADVVALQNALIQTGFLTMPAGIAEGFFGALTKAAVAKYQTSVGVSPIGVFGPATKAKLVAQLAIGKTALPNTGTGVIIPPTVLTGTAATPTGAQPALSPFQQVVQFIGSFYATLLDGIVTSVLLLAIACAVVMLFRRRR